MRRILLFFLAASFHLYAKSQFEEKNFVCYTVKEGLSENYITSLAQDDWGYMWIGTDIGLNRFDGHSFKKFLRGSGSLNLLSSTITKLKNFGPHKLGIVNRGGFQLLNTADYSLLNFNIPDSTAFSIYRNAAWDARELNNNQFAITTAAGFYVFDKAGRPAYRYDAFSLKDIGQKRILYGRDIFELGDQQYLVFINADELAYYDGTNKKYQPKTRNEKTGEEFYQFILDISIGSTCHYQLNSNEFIFIQFARNNIIYYNRQSKKIIVSPLGLPARDFTWESKITMLSDTCFLVNGGYSGFYQFSFNRSTGTIRSDQNKFLTGWKIQNLFLDKEKRLWAATSKGLLMQKLVEPVMKTYNYQPQANDSLTGGLSCAFRYKDKIYIGRLSLNMGFLVVDQASKKIINQIEFFGKNNGWNEIRSIQMYHPDSLWIGTTSGILWFDTKSNKYGKLSELEEYKTLPVLNVLAPTMQDGYVWMLGHLKGAAVRYHPASRKFSIYTSISTPALPFAAVKSISYDSYGDVWIGGHSLTRWNTKQMRFDTLISVYNGPNKFEEDILTMSADNKGSLWIHNANNGLLEYRIREKQFTSFTTKDGLPSEMFYGFSPVIDNHLFISGNNQLTEFNTATKKITVFDHQDGLPSERPSARYLYYDADSSLLYLFNHNALTTFSLPHTPPHADENNLLFEKLTVNNRRHYFYPPGGLVFKPGENNLSLHFSVINFESGNTYQFSYKLKETEAWTDIGDQRTINLTGLAAGHYTIWVKAIGKSGIEKKQQFSFRITLPFWKQSWFLIGVLVLTGTLLYYLYIRRIREVREKANIDKLISQAEMKALHAQMNPHFIFNCLNSIREMILNNESKDASHFLGKFAQLIRLTLDQSGQSFISLRNTMDYLHRYIKLEQIRNPFFTCRIQADPELDPDDTVMPPMLIQPFVENAIWHGASSNHKNLQILVDFKKQENNLICTIDDNGIGILESLTLKQQDPAFDHHSMGISNIKNRITLLNEKYNLHCSITIEDKSTLQDHSGPGTLVMLKLPLEITEHA